jgi:ribosomal protein S18 acetylase RimI-like enzyme
MDIRPMVLNDYEQLLTLMQGTPGVSLRSADSREAIGRYLERNPDLSVVAEVDNRIVGCIFAGHDGRRGYLYHLVVEPASRRLGIGSALVFRALEGLAAEGIEKTHIDVFTDNANAISFWKRIGWELRGDLHRFSFIRSSDRNV